MAATTTVATEQKRSDSQGIILI
ncbi:hypothetical protein H072_342 [Dactylellina haptotyla CBS 200.50]|uniref:Uncharacterized protein n=1 Tax=Dactylellina haptotyla (strain CBS 200.50) TaxID=1284197 RepID=S8AXF7_DACHA|nr:hypothetical protein H072_342 [Dactylellina haptotyla CBS 200.50]